MQFKNYLKAQMPFLALTAMAFILSSCGSYESVGEENDGIYSSSEETVESNVENKPNNEGSTSYYKNYFKEKSTEYDYIPDDSDEVFTDIDSYEGKYVEQDTTEQESYAGWGQENSDVTINVYGSIGWGYSSWWYGSYGYGYSPYWNMGWGYSGYYSPYWCPPYGYYGYPYYGYPYHGSGYYHNPYYGRNGVAYHNSRRGSSLSRMNDYGNYGRRSNANAITRDYNSNYSSRPRVSTNPRNNTSVTSEPRPRGNNSYTTKPRVKTRTNTSTPRPRTNTSTPRPRTNTYSSRPRTNTYTPRPSSGSSGSPSRGGRR